MIESVMDTRIQKAKDFLQYMQKWKGSVVLSIQSIVSDQLFDLQSMILSLEQVVRIKQARFPNSKTKPVILNQDVLENVFTQVRGSNGQNDHPKFYLYMSTIRSINFRQTVLNKRGNTSGDKEALPPANLPIARPFSTKKG
jgi:hypothetical protein